jgi:adenylate cyclase
MEDVTIHSCDACGAALPPRARFCPECGTPVAARPEPPAPPPPPEPTLPPGLRSKLEAVKAELRGDRREVAVLFADLKGFTSLSEGLDPEEITLIMNPLLQSMARVVYEYEGYVDKFTGDGVMALFGAPLAHENDAERAVLAGLRMLDAIARHNETSPYTLALRVGVNVGEVVAAQLGTEMRLQYTVLGDTVNVASRLEGAADPNSVLVSDAVRRRVAFRFDMVELPPLTLKGKAEPFRAFRVEGVRRGSGRTTDDTPFVGREAERARIEAVLGRARDGPGGALFVSGDAGAGKSRLVREALGRAGGGFRIVEVVLTPVTLPGQRVPVVEVFRQLAGDAESARAILGEAADEHRRGTLGLARASDPDPSGEIGETESEDPRAARENQWLAATALLEAAARRAPLALLVEDVHWSDEEVQEFFVFLLPQLVGSPLAVLLTGREPATWLPPHVERLPIGPLEASAAEAMLGEHLDAMPPEERRDLIRRSGGNPLYLEELTRALRETSGTRSVPGTLQGIIMSRIDRLPAPVQLLVQMGSVLGSRFPTALLARMYALEPQTVGFDNALAALESGDFLAADPEGDTRFRHALVQEVAYGGLLLRVRRVLHESAARIGEEHFADRLDAEAPFFAHHFWHAGLPEAAGSYLWSAGRAAAAQYSLPTAETFLRRAAEVLEAHPDVLPDVEELARFEETFGNVLIHRGDLDQAEVRFRRLEEQGASAGRPTWRARGMEYRGRIAWYRGRLEQARELFEGGLQTVPAEEDRIAADLHSDLGVVHYYLGNVEEAQRQHAEALRLRQQSEDRLGTAKSLSLIGSVLLHLRDDLDGAEDHYQRAYEIAESIEDRQMTYSALNNLGLVAMERGQCEVALTKLRAAERLLEDIGWSYARYVTLQNRAYCEIMLGRIGEAIGHLRICLDQGDKALEPVNRITTRLYLFDAYLRALADDQARKALTEAQRLARELGVEQKQGEIELYEGRWHAAKRDWNEASKAFARAEDAARRLNQAALLALARAHRGRALARAGREAPERPEAGKNDVLTVLFRYLQADAEAERASSANVAAALADVVGRAMELREVGLVRAAAERLAEVRRALGDVAGEREALATAQTAMDALVVNLPDELRESYLTHPRNAGLLQRVESAW